MGPRLFRSNDAPRLFRSNGAPRLFRSSDDRAAVQEQIMDNIVGQKSSLTWAVNISAFPAGASVDGPRHSGFWCSSSATGTDPDLGVVVVDDIAGNLTLQHRAAAPDTAVQVGRSLRDRRQHLCRGRRRGRDQRLRLTTARDPAAVAAGGTTKTNDGYDLTVAADGAPIA